MSSSHTSLLSTVLVEPDCVATITKYGDVEIQVGGGRGQKVGPELDTIQLSRFSHRVMSTAEQMGRVLQRTSISTNIKVGVVCSWSHDLTNWSHGLCRSDWTSLVLCLDLTGG